MQVPARYARTPACAAAVCYMLEPMIRTRLFIVFFVTGHMGTGRGL